MIAAMRRAHQRLAVQATVSGILAMAVTLLWAATGGGSFWPKWVWLGLAIPMGLHAALFGARQVKSRRARAIATHGAISGVISATLILIWAFAGFGFFWPLIPITVLAALLGLHAALAGIFWRPDEEELAERVDELTRTRRGALDVQAHELRRIERDLHDGAQARLVALTMQLGRAEARLEDHPEAAELVREARGEAARRSPSSRPRARDRPAGAGRPRPAGGRRGTRGTRADQDDRRRRGRAPAAAGRRDCGLLRRRRVDHQRRQARRPEARALVTIRDSRDALTIEIADNGAGGADSAGSGLTGLRHRVEALDGTLAVISPEGGGTTLQARLPYGS